MCTARNSDGLTETKVEVIVEGKPRASVPEPQMVVVEGRTATLRCHADGRMTRCSLAMLRCCSPHNQTCWQVFQPQ